VFSYVEYSKIKHNKNDAIEVIKGMDSYRISGEACQVIFTKIIWRMGHFPANQRKHETPNELRGNVLLQPEKRFSDNKYRPIHTNAIW
jgi:hypothetical protein